MSGNINNKMTRSWPECSNSVFSYLPHLCMFTVSS